MRCRYLAVLVAIAAAPAIAKEPALGFYVGAGAGVSSFRGDYASQVDQAYAGTGFTVDAATVTDDRDTAWKAYAGWRFHPYGAIEAAWLDFGEARTHYAIGVPNIGAATRDGRYRLSGVELSALGIVPIGDRATVYAKAGALFSQLKYDESGLNQFGEPGSFSHTNRETKLLWGLGGSFELVDSLAVRIEWQRAEDIGERFALTDSGNGRFEHVDMATIALQWRFR
jgi:OOP family OmpA-OmpF porin